MQGSHLQVLCGAHFEICHLSALAGIINNESLQIFNAHQIQPFRKNYKNTFRNFLVSTLISDHIARQS